MKVLPKNLRHKLKEPMGKLLVGKDLLELLKKEKYIVSIGDQVTYTLLKNDIKPIFCVVDYHTRRGICPKEIVEKIKNFGEKKLSVDNPQGTITDDLVNGIKEGFKHLKPGYLRIEVVGEEDLASLPSIFYAPSVVTIIYGLPDKGVLVIKPTKENKERSKEILDKM